MLHRKTLFRSFAIGVALALSQAACKPPENAAAHGHSHGHGGHSHGADAHAEDEDEHPAFPITVWTNGFEVFAEHEAIEAGKAVELVTHVTRLSDGQPKATGSIKFVITDASGASFEHVQSKPSQPGVYLPKINFAKAGEWQVALRIPKDGKSVEVSLGKVTVYPDHDAIHKVEVPEKLDGIAFLKEQQWNHPTLVRPVGRRDLRQSLSVPGEIHLAAERRGAITTPIAGRILAPIGGSRPRLGQQLSAGEIVGRIQPVFSEISSRLVEARAAVNRAAIELEDARKTFGRIESLAKVEAKSARDLQAAEKELRLAESAHVSAQSLERAYASANAGLLTGKEDAPMAVTLSAPIAGVVSELLPFATGEFVQEGTVIARTLDPREVQVHAFVPESQSVHLASVSGANVSRPGRADESLTVFNEQVGRIAVIATEVEPRSRSIAVHIDTPNPDNRYRIGQRLTVDLHLRELNDIIAVPDQAVIEEEGLTTVYVQVAGETFEKRIVRLGVRDGGWTQVVSGLDPGEMIVVENAYAIRLAAVAGGDVPHGHHH